MYSEDQVENTLSAIGVDIEASVGEDFIVFCPYHANSRTPAGEISKSSGVFFCFSCGMTATLTRFVMKASGKTYFEALRLIEAKEGQVDLGLEINKTLNKKPEFVEFDDAIVDRLHQTALNSERALSYFEYRGIADSIKSHRLGYSEAQDMVTVPVHSPDGMLLGFVARGIEIKRFKNTSHLPKSKTLFNLHRVRSQPHVFVVESSFDALRLSQVGLPAVATLGAGVSKRQVELLDKTYNLVYIVPDADTAGQEMSQKLHKSLGSKVVSIALPAGVKDVGDLTDKQINKLREATASPLFGVL